MRTISVYKLMQILLREDARSIYPALIINKLEDKILEKKIYLSDSANSFDEMEMEYPELVKVTSTEIQIKDVSEFKQKLNYRLRYVEDRELDKLVTKTWKTIKM